MGKASSNKKVARAASTGGGRTAGVKRPYGWYTVLSLIVALGVFLVGFSRHEQQAAAAIHPRGSDHWHAAYGIDICGVLQPNLPQNPNLSSDKPGIHTHGDGLIHIEPFVSGLSADAGNKATVARFAANYTGFTLTTSVLQYPGQTAHKNGDKCGKKSAIVRIRVWARASASASITYTNPKDVHLRQGQAITIAFLPAGDDIPKPPQAAINALGAPTESQPTTTLPTPVATVPRSPTTTAKGATPPPSAPSSPSTTARPGGSPPTTK